MGFTTPRTLVQRTELDKTTRIDLWNAISIVRENYAERYGETAEILLHTRLWLFHFHLPHDEQPSTYRVWDHIKSRVLDGTFIEAMNMLEDFLFYLEPDEDSYQSSELFEWVRDAVNARLESNMVGYRVMDAQFVPFDSEVEVGAVAEALEGTAPAVAREHLKTALGLLSDRDNPDYRNSVKESITAVESLARSIAGGKTLGEALPKLSIQGIETHGALVNAWKGFYGYTSDAGGVRHGKDTIAKVDQAFAKYVLVICSAFVTWLTEEARIAGKL
ncbi:hypothetical protein EDF39_1657 [Frondihabitans sp. PhB161]|nr:hypothetical protein EDF37_1655 [Frondihabitans sp. PhB153]RPF09248.1 hypothetical protein EDF39_1657 [Frondihabitans sp. PhB161]